jgi:hypothetical protein
MNTQSAVYVFDEDAIPSAQSRALAGHKKTTNNQSNEQSNQKKQDQHVPRRNVCRGHGNADAPTSTA